MQPFGVVLSVWGFIDPNPILPTAHTAFCCHHRNPFPSPLRWQRHCLWLDVGTVGHQGADMEEWSYPMET